MKEKNSFQNLGQYKAYLREIDNFDQLYIIQQGGRGVTRKQVIERLESAIAKDAEGVYRANESIWLNMKIGSYKKLEDLKVKDYNGRIDLLFEDICSSFLNDNRFVMMDRIDMTFNYLVDVLKNILKLKYNPSCDYNKLDDDRDKLEITLEQYKFAKYLLSGDKRDYTEYLEELEQYEVFSKDKAIMTLIDYKLARFGNDIFEEMGIEIIDRIDKGFIVRDNGEYKN